MKCSKNLFNKSVNSIVIPENWDYNRIDSIVSQILNVFQDSKLNYSLRYDGTTSEDAYIESIDEFIDELMSKIPIELSEYDKNSIVHQLRLQYYPQQTRISKSEDNIPIMAIIPEADLLSLHDKNTLKLDNTLTEFFGTSTLLKEDCKNLFKRAIFNATILLKNGKKSRKVTDIESLNQNIEDYKNSLYNNIYNYLISRGITPEKQLTQMFVLGENAQKLHEINANYTKVLDDFYLLLTNGNLLDLLEIEWMNKLTNRGGSPLLNAVNSYIQLLYFDELLLDSVDNFLSINDNQDLIIISNGDGTYDYKYSFGTTNLKGHKLFTEDIKDATKELGVFSKFLISNIPIRNSNSYMDLTEYFTAMLKLKDHLMNSTVDESLRNAMLEFHNLPEEKLKFIFESIITKEGNFRKEILDLFEADSIDYKLNASDVKIIESLYDFLYKGNDSVYNIEFKQLQNKGFDTQYPILKTILGAFDSVSLMDYMEIVYDYDSSTYRYQVKKKYYNKKDFFDFIDSINRKTRESGRRTVVNKYSPYFDDNHLKLNIGNVNYTIIPNDKAALDFGILNLSGNFKISATDANGKSLITPELFLTTYFDFNLDTISARLRLIDREELSENEELFMEMLSYIDSIIGTTFSTSESGLLELNLYLNQFASKETGFRKLFLGATKALITTKLHLDFQESESENFREWLGEHYPYSVLSRPNLDRDVAKYYFYNTYRGEFLYGVNKSKSDNWTQSLIDSKRILKGENTKATTKNLSGDSIPNTSPAFLGREVQQLINDENLEQETGLPTKSLIFNLNPKAIVGVLIDTDVRTDTGKIKQVASFSTSELLYHNFVNKFILPMENGRMLVQPTVYSDKKKFIIYDVSIKDALGKLLGRENIKNTYSITTGEFELLIIKTIGLAYYNLYTKVFDDYKAIFGTRDEKTINDKLRNLSSDEFIKLAQEWNIDVMEDIHYRKLSNGLSINELLQHYKDLYTNPELLRNRLQEEKLKFFNSITQSRTAFSKSTALENALNNLNARNWMDKELMVVAKDANGNNIFYGKIPEGATLNPLLENYFYSHILLANNLRFSLIGSELNHKVKSLKGATNNLDNVYTKEEKEWIRKNAGLAKKSKFNFADVKIALDNDLNEDLTSYKSEIASSIFNKYKLELYKIETAALNAQLKRTVTIPGTMRYFFLDSLDGIAGTLNVGVTEDIQAPVYLFSGKLDKDIDAHDGSAWIDPMTSILENLSLLDAEVGTIKKTLWHGFRSHLMSAELVKYALHTITNQLMRLSENSDIKMYNMFKKMTNQQWNINEIPDITNMALHKIDSKINFAIDILKGGKLFYKIGEQSYRIENFGKDDVGYYTEELTVNSEGETLEDSPKQKIYHFFDEKSGKHYRVTNGIIPAGTHTINSLFELHAALGGIYSESIMSDGKLHYSEASNYAVAWFMNNVCIKKDPNAKNPSKTLTNYYQPLKTKLINYLVNLSAIKNGALNVNKNSVLTGDSELRYFTMSSKRYGIQQDSDHEADEARMTEFSQVISSLDANGHYHDYVKEVYEMLGRVALEASKIEMDAIQEFRKNKDNFNTLYHMIGKILIDNISLKRGSAGLAAPIILSLKKEFNLSVDHSLDKLVIPLSDSNIYSQILLTFASLINQKSIKREYPGNGMIMTPGYGIILLWDIDGQTLLFEDILKKVNVKLNPGESVSEANRRAVKEYLDLKLKEIPISGNLISTDSGILYFDNADSFYPSDNVNVHYRLNGKDLVYTISLKTMKDYLNFIKNTDSFIKGKLMAENKYSINDNFEYIGLLKNITKSRDLAPAKITYSYNDKNGVKHTTNVFASYIYKNIWGNPTREQKQRIQKLLNNIDRGFIYLSEEDELNDVRTQIFDIKNIPAETVLSNIYQSKFGMNYYDSINDVEENSFSKPIKISHSNVYDIALVKGNNKSLYISIDYTAKTDEDPLKKLSSWRNLSKVEKVLDDGTIVHNVYVTDNNERLFLVGREIIRDGYTFNDGKYYNGKGEQVKGNFQYDGKNVWEYIEFVENARTSLNDGKNFRFYNINKTKLKLVYKVNNLDRSLQELDSFVAKLVKDIYNSDSYEAIIPNSIIPKEKLSTLNRLFSNLSLQTNEDPNLKKLLEDISGLLYGLRSDKTDSISLRKKKIGDISYQKRLLNYRDLLAHKKYISFQKALDFTSSRIPAQTLQSFMYMRCVGFTGVHTNQAYVSHFLTYLLGSKF